MREAHPSNAARRISAEKVCQISPGRENPPSNLNVWLLSHLPVLSPFNSSLSISHRCRRISSVWGREGAHAEGDVVQPEIALGGDIQPRGRGRRGRFHLSVVGGACGFDSRERNEDGLPGGAGGGATGGVAAARRRCFASSRSWARGSSMNELKVSLTAAASGSLFRIPPFLATRTINKTDI